MTAWSAGAPGCGKPPARVPLSAFSARMETVAESALRRLPGTNGGSVQNRFVGGVPLVRHRQLVVSPNDHRAANVPNPLNACAVRYAAKDAAQTITAHGVGRIKAMGAHAVVIGTAGKTCTFPGVALARSQHSFPIPQPDAAQGETKPRLLLQTRSNDLGLIGLPIAMANRPGHKQLTEGSAAVLFLRNQSLALFTAGPARRARAMQAAMTVAKSPCVDWYGNARPLFLKGRVFALMGYEIVERWRGGNRGGEKGEFCAGVKRSLIGVLVMNDSCVIYRKAWDALSASQRRVEG